MVTYNYKSSKNFVARLFNYISQRNTRTCYNMKYTFELRMFVKNLSKIIKNALKTE